jgi:hypothetical protein
MAATESLSPEVIVATHGNIAVPKDPGQTAAATQTRIASAAQARIVDAFTDSNVAASGSQVQRISAVTLPTTDVAILAQ